MDSPKVLVDLAPRFVAAFGFAPVLHPVPTVPGTPVSFYSSGSKAFARDNTVFEDLTLKGGGYDLYFGAATLSKSGRLGNIFAPPPMIAWRKSKNLIVTPIDGADAEVIERYGDRSWEISMQGLLVDMESHHYPLYKLEQLRKVFEVPDAFEVSGQIWDALGIKSLYFAEIEILPIQGFEDTCSFRLSCNSIKPVEFYLNDE